MKPGPDIWAANANWAAGPDVGTQSKTPPSAAQLADGYYRDLKVAPQIWNYMRWGAAMRLQGCVSMRLLNIFERYDISGLAGFTGNQNDVIWDPTTLTATYIENRAAAALGEYTSIGGLLWGAGAGFGGAPAGAAGAPRIAVDLSTGVRGVVAAVAATELPWASTAYAAFAQWPAGGLNVGDYRSICHTSIGGRWVFGDAGGLLFTSVGPGNALVAPPMPPGFAAAAVAVLEASNHAAGDVYPNDPGNDVMIALTATERSYSTDGLGATWAAAAAHGLANAPQDAGYSKAGSKWLAVLANGDIAQSLDNGATWAVLASLPIRAIGALSVARIATDGFGGWIALTIDATGNDAQVCVSWDDGVTWKELFLPSLPTAPIYGSVCYGGGQFIVVITDTGAASYVYTTLRGAE